MQPIPLFNEYDLYFIVTDKQDRLKRDYERLSDEDAVNDEIVQRLKQSYRMDVPVLMADQMTYDDHELERPVRGPYGQSITKGFLVHIPFDGDAGVFQVKPNASDGTVVLGNVTEKELMLTVVPPTDDYDLDAHIKRELAKVDFRLFHLRASTEYVGQQLDITIAQSIAQRRKAIETRTTMVSKLGIPKRQPPPLQIPVQQLFRLSWKWRGAFYR